MKEHRKIFGTDSRVVALGLARMADSLGNSFLIVVLPLYIASEKVQGNFFGLSESFITGLVLGLFGLVTSVFQPFAGGLSDRFGKRKLFVVFGLLLFTVANFLYSFAHSYALLMLIRGTQGLAAALTITASIALVSEVSEKKNRGNNMGVYNSFRLIGFGVGPLISGVLAESGPYNLPLIGSLNGFVASFYVASAAALISALLVGFLVDDPENIEPSKRSMSIRIRAKEKGRFFDPIFALGLATLIMSFGFALLAPIETETNQRLTQGAFLFSVEFSAMIGALAIFQPLVGKASDKWGRRTFIIIGLICLIPSELAQGLAMAPWQMITARACQGISASMVFAPSLALAGDLAEKGQTGTQLSVLTVAFGLGISLGAFLSGYAVHFGFIVPFVVGAVLAGCGALLVKTQVPKEKKDPE
ncbi:MAG: MFS transporter [Salegentibacter sp.]